MRGPAQPHPGRAAAEAARGIGASQRQRDQIPRLPPVRLAPREELAAAARVAPLLRAARDLARWAASGRGIAAGSALPPDAAAGAAADLELTPGEVDAAWRVATATGMNRRPATPVSQRSARTCSPQETQRKCWPPGTARLT